MTFNEYQSLALRTASMGLGVNTETAVRALGLCGEAAELCEQTDDPGHTFDGVVKELGDVMWYGATLASAFGLGGVALGIFDLRVGPKQTSAIYSGPDSANNALYQASKIAEIVKKMIGHGKKPDVVMVGMYLRSLFASLQSVAIWYGFTLESAAERNIAKLRERYPAGFDVAIAATKPDSDETDSIG